jgi:hypothetical protein
MLLLKSKNGLHHILIQADSMHNNMLPIFEILNWLPMCITIDKSHHDVLVLVALLGVELQKRRYIKDSIGTKSRLLFELSQSARLT